MLVLFHPAKVTPAPKVIKSVIDELPELSERSPRLIPYKEGKEGAAQALQELCDGNELILYTSGPVQTDPTAATLRETAQSRLTAVESKKLYYTNGATVYTQSDLNVAHAFLDDLAQY